jgi:hypothetical protein
MDLVSSRDRERDSASLSPRPVRTQPGPIERKLAQAMNASELMFFFGAPLAHVVDYEERLRANRCEKVVREVARSCRTLQLHAPIAMPPVQHAAGQPGDVNDA